MAEALGDARPDVKEDMHNDRMASDRGSSGELPFCFVDGEGIVPLLAKD